MLSPFLDERLAFEFSQSVESVYKETERAVPAMEKFTQTGFVFLETTLKPPSVVRLVSQYILSPATLGALRGVPRAKRYPLWEESNKQYQLPKKPFGLSLPLEYSVDPQTGMTRSTAPVRPAIPFAAIHLPGISPAVPPGDVALGKSWKSLITVRCGFGIFPLTYTTRWIAVDSAYATAESSFDPPLADPEEKTATLKDVQLRFRPAGTWSVTYALRGGVPQSAKGDLRYVVLAQTPGKQDVVETLNIKLGFDWKKVLLSFDNEYVQTAVWANPPKL